MDILPNIPPPSAAEAELIPRVATPVDVDEEQAPQHTNTFKAALARVEAHRTKVQTTLTVALLTRLAFELHLPSLFRSGQLLAAVPLIGMTLLAYMIVLWFLATRTRDRFGFGMALGIGVLVTTYQLVMVATLRPYSINTAWPGLVVAVAHLALAYSAFRSSTAFPPHDSKRPWIVGFVTALAFVVIPWVAPAVQDMLRR
jgi:hypothetical protein